MAEYDGTIKLGLDANPRPLMKSFKHFMQTFKQAFSGTDTTGIRKSIQKELEAAEKDVENFKKQYDAIMNEDVTPKSITNLEKELEKAQNEADRLGAKLSDTMTRTKPQRLALEAQGYTRARGIGGEVKVGDKWYDSESAAKLQALNERIESVRSEFQLATDKEVELKKQLMELKQNPELTPEVKQLSDNLQEAQDRAAALRKNLDEYGGAGEQAGQKLRGSIDDASKGLDKFTNRISKLAKRALFFSVITMAFRSMRTYIMNAIKGNDELSKSIGQLKGNLQVIFQFFWTYIMPVINFVLKMLVKLTSALASFLYLLTGKSISSAKKAAKELNKMGKAADKAAKKSLAAFDTINTLDTKEDSSSKSSTIEPTFDALDVKSTMDDLMVYLAGALLALGVVLLFSGANIPLGLGLIAVGVAGLAKAIDPNWKETPDNIKEAIDIVLSILAIAGLVLGAILIFSGAHLALGFGLLIMGLTAGGTEAALNWDNIPDLIGKLTKNLGLVIAGAALVMGAILIFSGAFLPLGLGLFAVGAWALVSHATVNSKKVPKKVKALIDEISLALSVALAVLGMIILLTGNLPLGLGLIVAGAAVYATAKGLDEETMKKRLTDFLEALKLIVGAALVVLGVIMLLNPTSIPLGLALIWEGMNLAKEAWTVEDNPIITWIKKVINGVIGLLNKFIDKVNAKLQFDIPDWLGGGHFGVNIKHIAELANGAVIPPNKEFLAVLGDQKQGTNIEAPLDTIVEAFKQALNSSPNLGTAPYVADVRITGSMAALAEILDIEITQLRRAKGV